MGSVGAQALPRTKARTRPARVRVGDFQAVACEERPSVNLGPGTHDHYFGCHAPGFLRDALHPPQDLCHGGRFLA